MRDKKTVPEPPALAARRQPRQARAVHKVELILEAAVQLLDEGDLSGLTTNAVAEKAGVSIGTLYQYFHDKQAILDALAQREVEALAKRTMASLTGLEPRTSGERIRMLVHAVLAAYGGRARVHQLLMEYGLSRGTSARLNPMFETISRMLATAGVVGPDGQPQTLPPADAFVLTYAIAGVLRGYVAVGERPAGRKEIEDALVRLTLRFLGMDEEAPQATSASAQPKKLSPRKSRPASRSTPG